MTTLAAAAHRNDLIAAADELRDGTPPDLRDADGLTPLMIAAGIGSPQLVELLLVAGADVHALEPRMGASALHKAAQGGSVDVTRLLLDHGAFIDLQSPTLGHTPLFDAVWYKSHEVAAYLLDRGAKTTLLSHYGLTALDVARRDGLKETAALIEARDRADAAAVEAQPLMAAVKDGDLAEVSRLLAAGAAPDERAPMCGTFFDGYTPLGVAAMFGHAQIVRELLAAGADPRRVDGLMKATPGHKSGYMGHPDALRVLLDDAAARRDGGRGLEVDAQGPYNGFTALHDAVWHGHVEAARVLVEAGARRDLRSHAGLTPLEHARAYGFADLAELLTPGEGTE
ncbi:hypothetical protein E1262_01205 [Jiangella aurantiaca]|uniref:Uncharacterized protein n=1 Tax=Jiangella aurantiaca TaxID=2530373 RepID=A0A4R5AJW2_9ACTN|nr:ankyrin repeat domain-containing protein [Jiangella aurantiaca]TDD73128.1 hypothetical protein E1262_01205 [Jiangella aurantiaca]